MINKFICTNNISDWSEIAPFDDKHFLVMISDENKWNKFQLMKLFLSKRYKMFMNIYYLILL